MSSNKADLITKIRTGEVDVNNQDIFFSNLIKGLLLKLDDDIKIRDIPIPHIILHTGDWTIFDYELFFKTKNIPETSLSSIEEMYSIIPRCMVNINNIDMIPDQISSPYANGIMQYEHEDNVYSLIGEFRRIPIKMACELKYYFDSYTDMLMMMQQVITKLTFIQTYNITYMGQLIKCSYKIPESFSGEHMTEVDKNTNEGKFKTLSLSLEIETSFPVWNNRTLVYNDVRISTLVAGINHIEALYENTTDREELDNLNLIYPYFKRIDGLDESEPICCSNCVYGVDHLSCNKCKTNSKVKFGSRVYGSGGINSGNIYEIG